MEARRITRPTEIDIPEIQCNDDGNILDGLRGGDIIKIDSEDELNHFEDKIVKERLFPIRSSFHSQFIEPWESRWPLARTIKPRGYNRRLFDIHVEMLKKPYAELVELRESHRRKDEQKAKYSTIGFRVLAFLQSSNREHRPLITPRIWTYTRDHSSFGIIGRTIESPDENAQKTVDKDRRDIMRNARGSFASQIKNPILTGMRD
ncbi:hypothetical protein BH23PAT2_BH23PAT2_05040 [soil metagenome]